MSAWFNSLIASIDWSYLGHLTLAALLGALVSGGELIGRYRDKPLHTVRTPPALFYILVNAAASTTALALIRGMGWTFGAAGEASGMLQIFVAGFGAMAIFRSAFFSIRVGDKDVAVGASSFLQVVLNAADNEVDRRRAFERAKVAQEIMANVSYQKAFIPLPTYAMGLMQNLTKEEREALQKDVLAIHDLPGIDDDTKAQFLGLVIINFVGEDVLRGAVRSLGLKIKNQNGEVKPARETLLERLGGNKPAAEGKAGSKPSEAAAKAVDAAAEKINMEAVAALLDEEPPAPPEQTQTPNPGADADSPSSLDLGKVSDLFNEEPKG